ncbi:unnamed protein product [Bursaphelenchus okinawaensis]|uniref:CMP/dCMP-type deaminase domain-containing protein n=1 Tax=Bursaphelenchus okinawaensis TaxID=465554 RepID=A0A811LJM1_9BILA|nr:unnamed protein product [Bursaphelenchus okinawaensis]CAG9124353.1 unnamed protein product [Bursaphelenchus okinawaensis]
MKFDSLFMEKAIEEGCNGVAADDGGPFGAVVVNKDGLVVTAHNMVLKTNDPTAHAEVTAIRFASKKLGRFDLSDCTLYTSCYPCPMCLGAILWAGIKNVYYAGTSIDAENAGFGDQIYHDFLKNPEKGTLTKLNKVEIDNRLKPFETWKVHDNKKLY